MRSPTWQRLPLRLARWAQGQFHLVTFPTQMGDGSGANRPWLQETPDPSTTVTWNTWVEINPVTAEELGLHDDDIVKVTSPSGEVEAVVYKFPAIRPDTVAIPFGQGHTALGRWAEGRGVNPANLLSPTLNEAGDLAFGDTLVTIDRHRAPPPDLALREQGRRLRRTLMSNEDCVSIF